MKSLQLTTEEKAAKSAVDSAPYMPSVPDFPYGTCICLDACSLEKIGITKLPAPGTVVELYVRAVVTGANVEATGEPCNLALQITEMDPPTAIKSDAETLYGKD